MKYYARKASIHDALYLAPRLRPADADEVRASHGVAPREALLLCLQSASHAYSLMIDNKVVGMFGVSPVEEGVGSPWMLCSDEAHRASAQFLRINQKWVDVLQSKYPLLMNYVDARNTKAIRWLRWCGFRLIALRPYGVEGRPFYEFCRINPQCVDPQQPSRP